MYIKRIIIKKKNLLKSIDLIYISLKRVQQFFSQQTAYAKKLQNSTYKSVVYQTLNHVHFRAYTGITIYICQSRICLKLAQEWNVLSDILVNFVKNAHEYIDQYMRAFFKFCYTTWVFSIIQNICEKKSIHEQKDRNPHIVKHCVAIMQQK